MYVCQIMASNKVSHYCSKAQTVITEEIIISMLDSKSLC